MEARAVTLEDWASAKSLWTEFEKGKHGWKIEGNLTNFKAWFTASLVSPRVKVFGIFDDPGVMHGFAVCSEVVNSKFDESGIEVQCLESFLRALYIQSGVSRDASWKLDGIMDEWGKYLGHVRRFGNCRMDFPTRGASVYGYNPKCIVMEKEL